MRIIRAKSYSDDRQEQKIGTGGTEQLFAHLQLGIIGSTATIHEFDTTEEQTIDINYIKYSNSFEVDISITTDQIHSITS